MVILVWTKFEGHLKDCVKEEEGVLAALDQFDKEFDCYKKDKL